MNNKDISIIVPVYNTSKYLNKCLDSIELAIDDRCEVIIVNDGSTDDSEKIIKNYIKNSKKGSQFSYYYKDNKGLADTKNFGLKKAKGKYISFIDSDDYISSDFFSVARKYMDEEYDAIIYDLYIIFENKIYDDYVARAYLDSEKIELAKILNGAMQGSSCNKIMKKDLYKYEFPVGREYEDAAVTPFMLVDAKKIKYLPYAMYYYLQRSNSIVGSNTLDSAFYKICFNIEESLKDKDIHKYEEIIKIFYLKRTILNLESGYKKKEFIKKLSDFRRNCYNTIEYIINNDMINKCDLDLTNNQKYLLNKIYQNIYNQKYKKVKTLLFQKAVLNKFRRIIYSFKR